MSAGEEEGGGYGDERNAAWPRSVIAPILTRQETRLGRRGRLGQTKSEWFVREWPPPSNSAPELLAPRLQSTGVPKHDGPNAPSPKSCSASPSPLRSVASPEASPGACRRAQRLHSS